MINNVVLVGRLVADPELKEVGENGKVVNFSLAVPRSYKNSDGEYEVDFIRCNVWNKSAENMKEYCKKGDVVGIQGEIQTSNYEDENGNKRTSVDVRVDKLTFLSSKKEVKDGE